MLTTPTPQGRSGTPLAGFPLPNTPTSTLDIFSSKSYTFSGGDTMYTAEFKNVGTKELNFTAEFEDTPTMAQLTEEVLKYYPGSVVRAHFGRVLFCGKHKGSYINHGTYTVTES